MRLLSSITGRDVAVALALVAAAELVAALVILLIVGTLSVLVVGLV